MDLYPGAEHVFYMWEVRNVLRKQVRLARCHPAYPGLCYVLAVENTHCHPMHLMKTGFAMDVYNAVILSMIGEVHRSAC